MVSSKKKEKRTGKYPDKIRNNLRQAAGKEETGEELQGPSRAQADSALTQEAEEPERLSESPQEQERSTTSDKRYEQALLALNRNALHRDSIIKPSLASSVNDPSTPAHSSLSSRGRTTPDIRHLRRRRSETVTQESFRATQERAVKEETIRVLKLRDRGESVYAMWMDRCVQDTVMAYRLHHDQLSSNLRDTPFSLSSVDEQEVPLNTTDSEGSEGTVRNEERGQTAHATRTSEEPLRGTSSFYANLYGKYHEEISHDAVPVLTNEEMLKHLSVLHESSKAPFTNDRAAVDGYEACKKAIEKEIRDKSKIMGHLEDLFQLEAMLDKILEDAEGDTENPILKQILQGLAERRSKWEA